MSSLTTLSSSELINEYLGSDTNDLFSPKNSPETLPDSAQAVPSDISTTVEETAPFVQTLVPTSEIPCKNLTILQFLREENSKLSLKSTPFPLNASSSSTSSSQSSDATQNKGSLPSLSLKEQDLSKEQSLSLEDDFILK